MFRIWFVYLLLYVPYIQNFKINMYACEAAAGAKLGKMAHLPQPTTGTSWEFHIYHFCL